MEIKNIIVQPTVVAGPTPHFVVSEARSFGGSSSAVPLTRENVEAWLPAAAPHINWEAKTFQFPLQAVASGGELAWRPDPSLEVGAVGDACVIYVTHALLAAGFAGNAGYVPSVSGGERLQYNGGDVVAAYCKQAATRPPEEVMGYLRPHIGIPAARTAVADALRRHFNGDTVPVLKDAAFRGYRGAISPIGEVEEVGRVPVDTVVEGMTGGRKVIWVRKGEATWSSFHGDTLGVLSRDGAFLVERRIKFADIGGPQAEEVNREGF